MKLSLTLSTEIKVEKLVPGGQALGIFKLATEKAEKSQNPTTPNLTSESGKKIFLWNALPEETVTKLELTKKKSSYLEGIALEIKNPSKHRVAPKDPCYLSTSPWQIFSYPYELEQKRLLVEEAFREAHIPLSNNPKISKITTTSENSENPTNPENPTVAPVVTDNNEWHYRNKMEYSLFWDKTENCIFLGFHIRGTHKKIKVAKSSIENKKIIEAAQKIVDDLNKNHEPAYKYQSLLLRSDQKGNISGGLYENRKPHPYFEPLTDKLLGNTYSYSPNGFFQINLPVYELALKEIKNHITTDKVLDLYSGVGTIGLSVASDKNLTLVESNKDAYSELEKNCREFRSSDLLSEGYKEKSRISGGAYEGMQSMAGVSRIALHSARLGNDRNLTNFSKSEDNKSELPHIAPVLSKSEEALMLIDPDQTVILDPPRAGCDKALIEKLLSVKPEKIIYLSCNPSTQARDVALLLEAYKIEKITPFNFFPKTPHIENLVILTKI